MIVITRDTNTKAAEPVSEISSKTEGHTQDANSDSPGRGSIEMRRVHNYAKSQVIHGTVRKGAVGSHPAAKELGWRQENESKRTIYQRC